MGMHLRLYLMRHGIAVDTGKEGVTCDRDRFLSAEGRKKTTQVAEGFKNCIDSPPGRIISSPYPRALETAEIIAHCLGGGLRAEPVEELAAGEEVSSQLRWLRRQPAQDLLWVGHMPDLSLILSMLTIGEMMPQVVFKKAGIAQLAFAREFSPGSGQLEWLLTPALCIKLRST